jgi:hypothetical protein
MKFIISSGFYFKKGDKIMAKESIDDLIKKTVYDVENVNKAKAVLDANGIYEDRAQNLAKIFEFDKNNYGDINLQTILRAVEIAKIK